MRKVMLICSLHRENGLCNVGELLKILRAVDPDVVFGEVSQSDINFYDPRSLEHQAVTRLRTLKPSCERVPVDRYDIPPTFRAITDAVFDFVEEASLEYQQLLEQRHHATNLKGFAYLNSFAFTQVMTRMSEMEEKAIKQSENQDLIRGLATWRQVMHGRERAMVESIYRYCKENMFDKGVFLVGAAHRSGVVKAIEESSNAGEDMIEWILNF